MDPIAVAAGWGFTAAMLPGPYQAYLINTVLNMGWRKSLPLVTVPLITNIPAIIVTVFALGQLPPDVVHIIEIIGGLYVAKMAYDAWRQFQSGAQIGDTKNAAQPQPFRRGLIVSLLNPNPYVFWATVGGPLLLQELHLSAMHGGAFLFSFYSVFMVANVGLIAVFSTMRRLDVRISNLLVVATIVLLGLFSVSLLLQGLQVA